MSAHDDEMRGLCVSVFGAAVSRLWRQGCDSAEIAHRLNLREHAVCTILARLQDERHAARRQGGVA